MKVSFDIPAFRRKLVGWYRKNARDLPWRRTRDPYVIWLSEVVLQQTRVEQGLPYFERFLAAFPTVRDLADAPERRVLKMWEGLGYYARARNMHRAAQVIARERLGVFPTTAAEWMRLPGVGRYTASAVTSAAFGEAVPIVDGNVARVLCRLFALNMRIAEPGSAKAMWAIAEQLVPNKNAGVFNQAVMELGSQVCRPRAPLCEICVVGTFCSARTKGCPEKYPPPKPAKRTPHYELAMGIFARDGKYLLRQRPRKGLLGGLWEFPSAKLNGESGEVAITNLASELGLHVEVGERVAVVQHAYTHFRVTVHAYLCRVLRAGDGNEQTVWLCKDEIKQYPLPKTSVKVLEKI